MNVILIILNILTLVIIFAFALMARRWKEYLSLYIKSKIEEQELFNIKLVNEAKDEIVNAICLSSLGFDYPVYLGGPSIDGWHARNLLFVLQEYKPLRILELGSGSSTIILAKALQKMRITPELHVSVDHESRFLGHTQELAKRNGVDDLVRFEYCPLQSFDEFELPWYSRIPEIIGDKKLDLVVIDGPPAYSEKMGNAREPALIVLRPYLSDKAVIILDDANRPGEQSVLDNWSKLYPEFNIIQMREGKGIAILTLKR